jgi:hypothetical protein
MIWADESRAAHMHPDAALEDRKQFVANLGLLLAQTREVILGAYLDDDEIVHVVYRNGHEELINVNMDSYLAIIRDVTKGL